MITRIRWMCVLLLLASGAAEAQTAPPAAATKPPADRVVSNHPQLFLDDYLISRTLNLRRDMKHPVKHAANPLIVQEFPWEKRMIGYASVMYDKDYGKFRAWYLASDDPDAKPEYYICYAESADGIRWRKPLVGGPTFRSYKKHNIVIPAGHGVCVLKTPWDPDPSRLYKAAGGDVFAVSPDGVHWATSDWKPATGKNDTCPSFAYWKGQYMAYVRYQTYPRGWPPLIRNVGLCVSKDFRRWTKKRRIPSLSADAEDGFPWGQPHALGATAYGDVLIGMLPMMNIIPKRGNNILGDMHVQLAVSRDGRTWHRVADRAVFMPQEKAEPWAKRPWDVRFHLASNFFVKDDKVYLYYTAAKIRWGEGSWRTGGLRFGDRQTWSRAKPKGRKRPAGWGIGLATLPADRFLSLRPVNWAAEGIVRTRPLRLAVKDLLINADVAADDLHVELLDAEGRPLPGFSWTESRMIRHDKLRFRAVWQEGRRRRTLRHAPLHQPIVVRIAIRDGDLYAFQVVK